LSTEDKNENPKTITDRSMSVTASRECGGAGNTSIRDSLNPLATKGVEVNSTQPQRKRGTYKGDTTEKRRAAALKGLAKKTEKAKQKSLGNLGKLKTHSEETRKKLSKKAKTQHEKAVADGTEEIRCKKISETMKGFAQTEEFKKRGPKISKTRLGWSAERKEEIYQNPVRNEKISVGRKKFLKENPEFAEQMIKRFMEAPIHRKLPNKPEVNVTNLAIPGLEYKGDGNYFVTLGETWKKNPDFIVMGNKRAKAVVELMDFEYWHKRSEIAPLTALYQEHKVGCLIIDAARCYKDDDLAEVKQEIIEFIETL